VPELLDRLVEAAERLRWTVAEEELGFQASSDELAGEEIDALRSRPWP
jgi:hypothetical protein